MGAAIKTLKLSWSELKYNQFGVQFISFKPWNVTCSIKHHTISRSTTLTLNGTVYHLILPMNIWQLSNSTISRKPEFMEFWTENDSLRSFSLIFTTLLNDSSQQKTPHLNNKWNFIVSDGAMVSLSVNNATSQPRSPEQRRE